MKTYVLSAVLFVVFSFQAVAVRSLPDGYGKAKWGMETNKVEGTIDTYPISTCVSKDPRKSSIFSSSSNDRSRKNEKYFFINNKLCMVESDMALSYDKSLSDCVAKYGQPAQKNIKVNEKGRSIIRSIWEDDQTIVELDEANDNAILRAYSKNMENDKGSKKAYKSYVSKTKTTIKNGK